MPRYLLVSRLTIEAPAKSIPASKPAVLLFLKRQLRATARSGPANERLAPSLLAGPSLEIGRVDPTRRVRRTLRTAPSGIHINCPSRCFPFEMAPWTNSYPRCKVRRDDALCRLEWIIDGEELDRRRETTVLCFSSDGRAGQAGQRQYKAFNGVTLASATQREETGYETWRRWSM